jgi:hypothetical protein
MAQDQRLYRVIFSQDDSICEVYAKSISEESLMGFLELAELVSMREFPAAEVPLAPEDTPEERWKDELESVQRTYIPTHLILRVDEVLQSTAHKMYEATEKSNVRPFPGRKKTT